jgi:hypothetical protein
MKDLRKRLLVPILSSVVLLTAAGVSNSYAQKPIDFTGTWQTIMMINGKNSFTVTLVQNGDQVTGSYAGNGKIEGTVSGRVLRFTWTSDRGTGSGRFVMDEKERAFSGTYNKGSNPDDVDSTWSGLRLVGPDWRPGIKVPIDKLPLPIPGKKREGAPEPMRKQQQAELEKKEAEYQEAQKNAPATFAGAWQTWSGEKIQYPDMVLQQAGDKVTGQLSAGRVDLGIFRDGIVTGKILRFEVWRLRSAFPFAPDRQDVYLGTGELVMGADGRSFTGTILGAATSGTLLGR